SLLQQYHFCFYRRSWNKRRCRRCFSEGMEQCQPYRPACTHAVLRTSIISSPKGQQNLLTTGPAPYPCSAHQYTCDQYYYGKKFNGSGSGKCAFCKPSILV